MTVPINKDTKPFIWISAMVILVINCMVIVEAAATVLSSISSSTIIEENPLIYIHNGLPRNEVYYLDDLVCFSYLSTYPPE
jgi:hypothetical protein